MIKNKIFKNNFIYQIINKEISSGKHKYIRTRFSPEPNGYLHIGHAKSICINFGIAKHYKGQCNLRFDDTNPSKENTKYINSIKNDIKWLGFNWNGNVKFTSDYFNQLYNFAIELIKKKLAYVDLLSIYEIKNYRGTLINSGINSPYRNQSINKNLLMFYKMKNGEFKEGEACLRAKINMSSPIMVMRDPVLYRIKFIKHHQTGNKWCIYPMYDFAHCISDALEGITHSLCTLEFTDNKKLYNWILNNININCHPKQYEFSRLNIEYNTISKRKLNMLVSKNIVDSWEDPRLPTISGLRRRGYTPSAIKNFCNSVGITRQDCNIKISILESFVREELNKNSPRVMAVINPIKLIIESLPEQYESKIVMANHPKNLKMGTRLVVFSREIFIDKNDFREKPEIQYKRLVLGKEVRLRNSYIIKAKRIEKDACGNIIKIFCSHDPNTLNKHPLDGRKVKGVIHWVSAKKNVSVKFHLYDKLFSLSNPNKANDFFSIINKRSIIVRKGFVELEVLNNNKIKSFQFEREGYFCIDKFYKNSSTLIFNKIVGLKNLFKKLY